MPLIDATIEQPNTAVSIAFLRRVAAPAWELMADAKIRTFSEKTADKARAWIAEMQRAGKPVYALMPRLEDGHWWLAARLPLEAAPAELRIPPQMIVVADDFVCLWRLAEPVPTARAKELVAGIVGKLGKPAPGEPVPLPGTLMQKAMGVRLAQMYPVRLLPVARSPGYRIDGERLVDVMAKATAKHDPRHMAIEIGDGAVWRPSELSNAFLVALGGSGSGKTVALRKIGAGVHTYGIPTIAVDFHGDVELPGVPTIEISSAPDCQVGINPLQLDVEAARKFGLYDQRLGISEMVRRAIPQLGHRQMGALLGEIEEAYAAAGIEDAKPETWAAKPPRFADVIAGIENAGLLAATKGLFGHPAFARPQQIGVEELLKSSVRLDISKLPESVRYIIAETILRRLFTALRMRGPVPERPADDTERLRIAVIVDEARLLTQGGKSAIVDELLQEARKYGLAFILASQAADHFSAAAKNNFAAWLVLKPQTMAEARINAPNAGVEPEELFGLRGRGDGFLRLGNSAAQRIQVKPV